MLIDPRVLECAFIVTGKATHAIVTFGNIGGQLYLCQNSLEYENALERSNTLKTDLFEELSKIGFYSQEVYITPGEWVTALAFATFNPSPKYVWKKWE